VPAPVSTTTDAPVATSLFTASGVRAFGRRFRAQEENAGAPQDQPRDQAGEETYACAEPQYEDQHQHSDMQRGPLGHFSEGRVGVNLLGDGHLAVVEFAGGVVHRAALQSSLTR